LSFNLTLPLIFQNNIMKSFQIPFILKKENMLILFIFKTTNCNIVRP